MTTQTKAKTPAAKKAAKVTPPAAAKKATPAESKTPVASTSQAKAKAPAKSKTSAPAAKKDEAPKEPTYSVSDLMDHIPGPLDTQGNRDGALKRIEPETSVQDWMASRPDADKVVESVMATYPADPAEAAKTLVVVATYETGDASSWSDAAQASRVAEVGKRSGPGSARTRYEKVVPSIKGKTTATKLGQHYRSEYKAAIAASNPDAETTTSTTKEKAKA